MTEEGKESKENSAGSSFLLGALRTTENPWIAKAAGGTFKHEKNPVI